MLYRKFGKRLFDVAGAAILLPLIGLVSVPVAIAIRLEDKGPVFFRSKRLGVGMRQFDMMKFRSMNVNAPDIRNADGSTFNDQNDSRVTKVGRFLRSTSIDELPQIWNVLVGDMSFIGPRPSPTGNEKTYSEDYLRKFAARPGITGLSQSRRRNAGTLAERANDDLFYVDHQCFKLDVSVLLATIVMVVRRKNIHRTLETQ